jgi:hypothetical protein
MTLSPTTGTPSPEFAGRAEVTMSHQQRELLALVLSFLGLFLLWYFPDYKGAIAASLAMLASIFIFYLAQRTT